MDRAKVSNNNPFWVLPYPDTKPIIAIPSNNRTTNTATAAAAKKENARPQNGKEIKLLLPRLSHTNASPFCSCAASPIVHFYKLACYDCPPAIIQSIQLIES